MSIAQRFNALSLPIYEAGTVVKRKMATQPPFRRFGGKKEKIEMLADL
ncbi:MAG: hypothetical protein ACREEM_50720 [Blastocatellia bacterium]